MGANKELQSEIRGYEKPNPETIMQQMIGCKDENKLNELMTILDRVEPYNITNRDYFNILIQTPLANLQRVYVKYGTYDIGHNIRRAWSLELSNKIAELKNLEPEETLQDVFAKKYEIAKSKGIEDFVFMFKGKIYIANEFNGYFETVKL